jgi:hypothetical protein
MIICVWLMEVLAFKIIVIGSLFKFYFVCLVCILFCKAAIDGPINPQPKVQDHLHKTYNDGMYRKIIWGIFKLTTQHSRKIAVNHEALVRLRRGSSSLR